jgi:hypothetical protein
MCGILFNAVSLGIHSKRPGKQSLKPPVLHNNFTVSQHCNLGLENRKTPSLQSRLNPQSFSIVWTMEGAPTKAEI